MLHRSVLLTAVLVLAAATATGEAMARQVVLGPADGVQASLTGGRTLEVRFTGAGAASTTLHRRRLHATCGPRPSPVGLQFARDAGDEVSSGSGTVSPQGVLHVQLDRVLAIDACELTAAGPGPDKSLMLTVARVSLGPAGDAWLDEVAHARPLTALLRRARAATAYRPAAQVAGGSVVALAAPSATPPAGQIGYWTDGARHAAAVTLSAAGRRLVLEDIDGSMLQTNVFEQGGVQELAFAGWSHSITFGSPSESPDRDGNRRPPFDMAPPVDVGDGVQARLTGRRLTMRFTGRSAAVFRVIAGRRVSVSCFPRPSGTLLAKRVHGLNAPLVVMRLPRHGGTLTATLPVPGDLCIVVDDAIPITLVPVSRAGRDWVADITALSLLFDKTPGDLAPPGATAYWPTPMAAAHGEGLVALESPGAAVRSGRVGVWTDGAKRALLATTSASGRRVLWSDEGDGMLRTNAFGDLASLLAFGPV